MSFTVTALASSHQIASTAGPTLPTDVVGAGSLDLTVDAVLYTVVTTATTTLTELAEAISDLNVGLEAAALDIGGGNGSRLVISSETTGATSSFTATTGLASLGGFSVASQAGDATIQVGTGPGALTIQRATNTLTDVVDGLVIDLVSTTATQVTVTAAQDAQTVGADIELFVTTTNQLLDTIDDLTLADGTDVGLSLGIPVLRGDGTLRALRSRILDVMTHTVASLAGPMNHGARVGLGVTRHGRLSFDSAHFAAALASNREEALAVIGHLATSDTTSIAEPTSLLSTEPGVHPVVLDMGAREASIVGTPYIVPTSLVGVNVFADGINAHIAIGTGSSLAAAVQQLNDGMTLNAITSVVADAHFGAIRLRTAGLTGSAVSFQAFNDTLWNLTGVYIGSDPGDLPPGVTVSGAMASVSGLDVSVAHGPAAGLTFHLATTTGEVAGNVTTTRGLLGQLSLALGAFEGASGRVAGAQSAVSAGVHRIDDRLAAAERAYARRTAVLERQITAMQAALSSLRTSSSQLRSLFGDNFS